MKITISFYGKIVVVVLSLIFVARTNTFCQSIELLKDIRTLENGENGSVPSSLFHAGDRFYFSAFQEQTGYELWITDGTDRGTYKLKTLLPRPRLSYEQLGDLMVFTSRNHFGIENLRYTDGTVKGTKLITEYFWLTGASRITSMKAVNDILFFTLVHIDTGEELWRTDGTKDGTYIVQDLMPGKASSSPKELTAGKDVLYFSADHPEYGRELFYVKVPPSKKSNTASEDPFEVFPNPSTDHVHVEFTNHKPGQEHTIALYNVLGQRLYYVESTLNPIYIETAVSPLELIS
ncbi:MAG: ELWxxDGT repeat protein [Bacteroidia bacterium]|jgi:ELWxxDGT repeat protein